jgi:Domain of Unknown Function with PDB structure (DUF3857)
LNPIFLSLSPNTTTAMKRTLLFLLTILWISAHAQKSDKAVRFGRLDPVDFKSTICPIDSNAHAYYLFDYGNSSFLIFPDRAKIVFERHFRIKILDKSAFDEGTFSIPLFYTAQDEEELINLKASTYNLENGAIVETKMEKTSIFKENTSERWKKVKFTLPNIKEGSVLEVKYEIHSDFLFNYQGWVFQRDIPVLVSEYITDIPDILIYNPHHWGYVQIDMNTTTKSTASYSFKENVTIYQAKNVPAFPDEPYINNKENYRSRVEFELASTRFSDEYHEYTSSWKALNAKLLEADNFGVQLAKTGYFKDEIETIKNKNLSLNEKIETVFNLVKKHIKWNGIESIYTTGNIKKAYDDGLGNVADINLTLISMLRSLDVNAYPLVLSTVDHGFVLKDLPTLTQLNYVIALIIDGDKRILLDASDPFATPALLPAKCLNGAGRLINDQEGLWIDLKTNRVSMAQMTYRVNLDPEKGLKGNYIEKDYHFAGYKIRSALKDSMGLKQYVDKVHEKYKGIKLNHVAISGFNELSKEVSIEAEVESTLGFESTGELIYFNPIQMERLTENPFKAIERKFPVEFEFPAIANAIVEIKLPEGYAIESMPKSGVFMNEDKSAKFTFVSESTGPDVIKVSSLLYINKARFNIEEYTGLKELYSHIVAKHAEQIVLKKKS